MARDKLEFTAWFEVNRTFGSGDIIFLILGGPIGPPPRRLRVVYLTTVNGMLNVVIRRSPKAKLAMKRLVMV